MEKARLNLMIPEEINEKMREMAKDYGMTLSGLVAMIMKQYFDQQELLKRSEQVPKWLEQIASIKKDNCIISGECRLAWDVKYKKVCEKGFAPRSFRGVAIPSHMLLT